MSLSITIVFDNYSLVEETIPSWGFSCVVQSGEHNILFDTGNDGNLLLNNVKELGFEPLDFDHVFISHMHWDHVGGLIEFLRIKPNAHLYLVNSALPDDVKHLKRLTQRIKLIDDPVEILPGVYSLGDLPGYLNEQTLAVDTADGLVLLTGCSHPGIVNIVAKAKQHFPDKKVELVMGGFHLDQMEENHIHDIVDELLAQDVHKIAPSHCTGDYAIEKFKQAWGDNFIDSGIGLTITYP